MNLPLLLLSAALAAAFAGPLAAADLPERLAACAACHGERGEGIDAAEYIPHLAGKPAGYLFDQLQAFRDGRRHYGPMVWLVRVLDDRYLHEIAAFYAAQPPVTGVQRATAPLAPALAERARRLVEHGDRAKDVPACSACHGDDLAGLEPGVPALLGLPADYIVAQLGAWRTGVRASREPDCMRTIAQRLDPTDLHALGAWLSAQGDPDGRRPAPAGSRRLPLRCGSLPAQETTR